MPLQYQKALALTKHESPEDMPLSGLLSSLAFLPCFFDAQTSDSGTE
jgi:hypothetical protein